ncbi:DEK protein [Tanacetum coccineum]
MVPTTQFLSPSEQITSMVSVILDSLHHEFAIKRSWRSTTFLGLGGNYCTSEGVCSQSIEAPQIKSDILQFSGFVWHDNEVKQKAKVQEKLNRLNKEKLFEFCDLLDIPIAKTTAEKEDVIEKLIDFMLLPHATTSESHTEKEQASSKGKRKRESKKSESKSEATPTKNSSKKKKTQSESEEDSENSQDKEEETDSENKEVNGGSDTSESEEEHVSESESEEESKKHKRGSKKPISKKQSAPNSKSKKKVAPKKSSGEKKTPTETKEETVTKTFSRKKKDQVVEEKSSSAKKSASKEKSGKKDAEKEKPKEEKLKPSDDEVKAAISELLKGVDFNTATFTDILKLLNKRFKTDLAPRKTTVKFMIQDELTKIADAESDDEDEDEAQKTAKEAPAQKA